MAIRDTLCCARGHIGIQWVGVPPCPLCASHDKIEAHRRIIEAARQALDLLDIALGDSDLLDPEDEGPVAQAFQILRSAIEAADRGKPEGE